MLSEARSLNLRDRLNLSLRQQPLDAPKNQESEPAFTRRCLYPIIESELGKISGLKFQMKGDGSNFRAIPANALDISFFPDLAVSFGFQNLWAAEVKFLRMTGRQNSLATAIGQAALYLGRYEHVSLVLIDLNPSTPESRQQFEYQARQIGLEAVIRPRLGDRLSTQSPSS